MATQISDTGVRRRNPVVEDEDGPKGTGIVETDEEMDDHTKEYIEYFRNTYGDNPRSDILGLDGVGLFCLIYVFIAGVIFSLIFFSVYTRHRPNFARMFGFGGETPNFHADQL
eukprot:CAMPEP_0204271742 /NCGR_PEP_ID=MMETSP0468-20130131/20962_1 /ASSEMBLY_ACC=CAM_ASM_000383 /TAXON_ID=2969 /ORGANISM="Oxyrrhis marina" /LENGTH=112 /DNA_ID=CAMNT_0051247493 /DNA_START=55 /DNA_END=393 /DNA_ORIENTATION=-